LNLYRSDVRDAIDVVFENGFFQSQNFEKFVKQGGEARLDYALTKQWSLFTAADFNDVRNAQTDEIVRDAGIARESFKWGASYTSSFGQTANLEARYSRWSSMPGMANDRKPILDLKLTQDFKHLPKDINMQIFFNIYNLTNSSYWSDPTFPLPGRHVEGGVSIKF
jgi:outer membrane receptor protein involved in Fe transport